MDHEPIPDLKPLILTHAAIRAEDGTIYSVPRPGRHHDVIRLMRASGYLGTVGRPGQQGFLSSDGAFHDRQEALVIARLAKQLKNGRLIGSVLTSEDLW